MNGTTTLILGGGFGGIAAANALRELLSGEHAVVLIDRAPTFCVGAGKTWLMLGERSYEDISRPRAQLLRPGITVRETGIVAVEVDRRSVATAEGDRLPWDHLVIALGADVSLASVPGLERAYGVRLCSL